MYCGIDDILQQKKRIKLMKAYQINDGLNDTFKEKSIQRSNQRRHWRRIQWQRRAIF